MDLILKNGKHIDKATGKAYTGVVSRSLSVGDTFQENDEKGSIRTLEITNKIVHEDGSIAVYSKGV